MEKSNAEIKADVKLFLSAYGYGKPKENNQEALKTILSDYTDKKDI